MSGNPPLETRDGPAVYDQDGLRSVHNHEFVESARFVDAYQRGVAATGQDYDWRWRVHIGLWAAQTASRLPGDFVECGVNNGFLSSSIMQRLDWDRLGKQFYLLDTFRGVDERQYLRLRETRRGGREERRTHRVRVLCHRSRRVRQFRRVAQRDDHRGHHSRHRSIGFRAEHRLPAHRSEQRGSGSGGARALLGSSGVGAPVLLDDYAYDGYRHQKLAMDGLAERLGVSIASLPTGQGLLLKT